MFRVPPIRNEFQVYALEIVAGSSTAFVSREDEGSKDEGGE